MATPFITPTNEKSFSGLIDAAILATGKPGSLVNAVQYANLTVRECQALGLFAQDLIEDTITASGIADGTSFYSWTRPQYFRSLRTVKYTAASGSNLGRPLYPKFLKPGRQLRNNFHYFYAADNYFIFNGVANGDTIGYAAYFWVSPLAYFARLDVSSTLFPGGPYSTRLAYFDILLDKWQYLNATMDGYVDTTGDPVVDEARQEQALHWLVNDWYDLILSGTKAKIWGSAGDTRGPIEYSLYTSLQKKLQFTTDSEAEGF